MAEITVGTCKSESTCYECKDSKCWHSGDIQADCQALQCLYDDDLSDERCFTCRANGYAQKNGVVK